MNHGKPVGPALSPTCTLGQAFKGRKTDEAKARGFSIKARGAKQSAPFSKRGAVHPISFTSAIRAKVGQHSTGVDSAAPPEPGARMQAGGVQSFEP
jgi:hypothetical protein